VIWPRKREHGVWHTATQNQDGENISHLLRSAPTHPIINGAVLSAIVEFWPETPAAELAKNDPTLIAEDLRMVLADESEYSNDKLLEIAEALVAWIKQLLPWHFPVPGQPAPASAEAPDGDDDVA